MAGCRELLAIEWDNNAASTFSRNFPDVALYHGDIAHLTVEQVLSQTGISPGELDIFDGSPPCQGFSVAGRRQLEDPRNELFREYVRLLEGLRPKVMVMENVSGLVKGKMKLVFAEILRELRRAGYRVSARLMNTMFFGVPQSRQRLIFVGVREDLGVMPSHPEAQTGPIIFANACWDLQGNSPEDRMLSDVIKHVALYQPDRWATDLAIYKRIKGNTGSAMALQWAGWNRVCGTIVKSEIALSGIVHPDRERYISLAEAKRLASYPEAFSFSDRKNGIARIGNSVPPLFMRALAEHIIGHILKKE